MTIFLNIIPKILRRKIYTLVRDRFVNYQIIFSSKIPKFELNNCNIKNVKVLLNREDLLESLPKNSIVAELWVDEWFFSEKIIQICRPKKLHLIDVWWTKFYNKSKQNYVENKFSRYVAGEEVSIHVGLSTEVYQDFQDNYFDWIYIDTDHSYETTILELEYYRKKMKDGWIIAGHDFIVGYWEGMIRYGVREAVYEFCLKYSWEIIYLTAEINDHPSFAIRQINNKIM